MQDLTPPSANRRERRAAKAGKRNAAAPATGKRNGSSPAKAATAADRALQAALERHRGGDVDGAEAGYRAILDRDPEHPDSLHLLGVLLTQRHNDGNAEALSLLARAAEALPDNAQVAMHHGVALRNAGDLAAAEQELQRALKLGLDSADAHNNLATIYVRQDRPEAAREALEAALTRDPEHGAAQRNLAALEENDNPSPEKLGQQEVAHAFECASVGAYQEAIDSFYRASRFITLTPDYRYKMAECMRLAGHYANALAEYEHLGTDRPDYYRAKLGVALVEHDRARYAEALDLLDQLPETDEEDGWPLYLRASCLFYLGRHQEADYFFRCAAEVMSDKGLVYNDHGRLMQKRQRNADAIMLFLKSIRANPSKRAPYVNLGNALKDHGRVLDAVEVYQHALENSGDADEIRSNLLFSLNYVHGLTRETVFAEHALYRPLVNTSPLPLARARDLTPDRRLRIGYVSGDFRKHSCAFFFDPVLFGHNRDQFEITLYSNVKRPDSLTAQFRNAADRWRNLRMMGDEEAARQVQNDEIDILVEMNGHTADHRLALFAYKPAPIQVSWLGYPNTTGVPEIDYRLSDEIVEPAGDADRYSTEQIIRMPNGFHCYSTRFHNVPVAESPCLDNGYITFGSFNYLAKIGDPVIDTWAEILKRVPDSRLLMKARGLGDVLCRDAYLEHFEARGIGRDRIDIVAYTETSTDHLRLYSRVDIALDPFPYNGTTTTVEAMWMGVPVIALLGEPHAARVSASLLTRVGLEPLIGADIPDYVTRAVELASDTQRLAQLRREIRPAMAASPLCDGPGFVRDLEAVYRQIWRAHCKRVAGAVHA